MSATHTTSDDIREVAEQLPQADQERVLEFARALARSQLPPGTRSDALLRFAGVLPLETVEEMERALEDCERIDADES